MVAAPSKLQRPPGDRVKPMRDARHLANLLRMDQVLGGVRVACIRRSASRVSGYPNLRRLRKWVALFRGANGPSRYLHVCARIVPAAGKDSVMLALWRDPGGLR